MSHVVWKHDFLSGPEYRALLQKQLTMGSRHLDLGWGRPCGLTCGLTTCMRMLHNGETLQDIVALHWRAAMCDQSGCLGIVGV